MKDRLIELIYCAGRDYDNYVDSQHEMGMPAYEDFDEWLADELLANGVIVPPCKVGDIVYCLPKYLIDWIYDEVEYITFYKDHILVKTVENLYFEEEDFGKTVFLTKEEAEQALKERDV